MSLVHSSKLYIWVGKTASLAEKREATAKAKEYLAQVHTWGHRCEQ